MHHEVGGGTNCTFGKLESWYLCRTTCLQGYKVGRVEIGVRSSCGQGPSSNYDTNMPSTHAHIIYNASNNVKPVYAGVHAQKRAEGNPHAHLACVYQDIQTEQ